VTARFDAIAKPSLESIRPHLRAFEPSQGYPRGAEFFPQGAPSQSVFVLVSGIARLERACHGARVAIIGIESGGSMLGAHAVLSDTAYLANATAVTRCEAYRIPARSFRDLVRGEPACSWYLHQLQAYEYHLALSRIAGLSCLSARERLESFIEELTAALQASGESGEIPLRDRELAQLVAVTPPYLSRLVKKMIDQGRLRRIRGAIHLTEGASAH
jgi:CRP-like cAMP-binding protein